MTDSLHWHILSIYPTILYQTLLLLYIMCTFVLESSYQNS